MFFDDFLRLFGGLTISSVLSLLNRVNEVIAILFSPFPLTLGDRAPTGKAYHRVP